MKKSKIQVGKDKGRINNVVLTPHSEHKKYCQYLNPFFLIARNRVLSAADLEIKHFIFQQKHKFSPS